MNDSGGSDFEQRLKFLVQFAQMDLDVLRPGSWMNLRDDLQVFLQGEPQRGDLITQLKDTSMQEYPERAIKSLQGILKILVSQAADASEDRTGRLKKVFGIPTYLSVRADFHVIRHPGDFVQLAISGKLSDVFLFKTLFLLSLAPIEPIKECPECGKIFFRQDKRQKFCRRRCANLAATKRFDKRKRAKKGRRK